MKACREEQRKYSGLKGQFRELYYPYFQYIFLALDIFTLNDEKYS